MINAFQKIDHGTENKKRCGTVRFGTVRYGHGTKFGPPTAIQKQIIEIK